MIAFLLLLAAIGSTVFFSLLVIHDIASRIRARGSPKLDIGDVVVYRKQKVSSHPSPHAYDVRLCGPGETYQYCIDKYWTVENVLRDGRIVVTTRTHKHHYLLPDDPNLRKAGLIVRLRNWKRFPELSAAA
ncbi:MAG TPA: hypothetical protein VGM54_09500 [Chthoniobacter sp.]|jgi:hypothetical protein